MDTMRLIVKFKTGTLSSGKNLEHLIEEIEKAMPAIKLVRAPGKSGRAVFSVAVGEDVESLAMTLGQNIHVAYAEPEGHDRAVD